MRTPQTTSSLPLFPALMLCISIFIFICHKLFPKFIPTNYLNPTLAHIAWGWNFLLHFSHFPNSTENNGYQGLRTRLYEAEPEPKEVEECAVCLCKIEEGEEKRELRCGHVFHRECLDRWIGHRNETCPLCRSSLAPPRMVNEVGEEVIVFKFSSFTSAHRTMWWLR